MHRIRIFNEYFNFKFRHLQPKTLLFFSLLIVLLESGVQAKFTLDFSKELRKNDYDFSEQARQELGLANIDEIYQQTEELSIASLPPHDLRLK